MKILFFIDSFGSGGKERRLTELMKSMAKSDGLEFELVVMESYIHFKEVLDLNIRIHYLKRKTKKDFQFFYKFYKLCQIIKPDIIHCWDSMTAMYSVPICKVLKIKLVNGMVTNTPVVQNISNKNWLRARLSFPFSDRIVGNSKSGLEGYRAAYPKSVCIYNGMDLKRFENLPDKNQTRKTIFGESHHSLCILGMVAAFEPRKDYNLLIDTALKLTEKYRDIAFVFVGGGSMLEEMMTKISTDQSNRLKFLGNRQDVESIENIFDVGVLLTNSKIHGEGISNSIIEYMALSKPVIATKGGGTMELIVDGWNGFLIEPFDETSLIEKIDLLRNDKETSVWIGKNGREMVEKEFNIRIMTEQYIKLYNQLLN